MSALLVREPQAHELQPLAAALASLPLLAGYGLDAGQLFRGVQSGHASGDCLRVACAPDGTPAALAWWTSRGAFGVAGYLRLLAVVPAAQGGGFGTALCAAFEKATADARGGQMVLCNTNNGPALRFYALRGYLRVGTVPNLVRVGCDEALLHRARPSPIV